MQYLFTCKLYVFIFSQIDQLCLINDLMFRNANATHHYTPPASFGLGDPQTQGDYSTCHLDDISSNTSKNGDLRLRVKMSMTMIML